MRIFEVSTEADSEDAEKTAKCQRRLIQRMHTKLRSVDKGRSRGCMQNCEVSIKAGAEDV